LTDQENKIIEIDLLDNTIIHREMLDEEIAEYHQAQSDFEAIRLQTQTKVAARESALSKLAELGLTAEEIAAL